MANHKPQPVKTLRMAKVQVAIWENQGQKGPFHTVTVSRSYYDEDWKHHEETFKGMAARVIQHEYDHIEGKLFTDKLSPLRKRMIEKKLNDISKGIVDVDYKMKFPAIKKGR